MEHNEELRSNNKRRKPFVMVLVSVLIAALAAFVMTPLMGTKAYADEQGTIASGELGSQENPITEWADLKKAIEEDGKTGDIYITGNKIVADSPIEIKNGNVNIKGKDTANVYRKKADSYDTLFKVSKENVEFSLEGVTLSGKTVNCPSGDSGTTLDNFKKDVPANEKLDPVKVKIVESPSEGERYALYSVGSKTFLRTTDTGSDDWAQTATPDNNYNWYIVWEDDGRKSAGEFLLSNDDTDATLGNDSHVLRANSDETVFLRRRGQGKTLTEPNYEQNFKTPSKLSDAWGNFLRNDNGILKNDQDRDADNSNIVQLVTYYWEFQGKTYKTFSDAQSAVDTYNNANTTPGWEIPGFGSTTKQEEAESWLTEYKKGGYTLSAKCNYNGEETHEIEVPLSYSFFDPDTNEVINSPNVNQTVVISKDNGSTIDYWNGTELVSFENPGPGNYPADENGWQRVWTLKSIREAETGGGCDAAAPTCEDGANYNSGNFSGTSDAPKGFFVQVEEGATFTLKENAELTEFVTDGTVNYAAPVVVNGGTFEMKGGSIKGNSVGYTANNSKSNSPVNEIEKLVKNKDGNGWARTETAGALILTNGAQGTINGGTIEGNRGDTGAIVVQGQGDDTADSYEKNPNEAGYKDHHNVTAYTGTIVNDIVNFTLK